MLSANRASQRTAGQSGDSSTAASSLPSSATRGTTIRTARQYRTTHSSQDPRKDDALADNGANGGMTGSNMLIVATSDTKMADITGLANHTIRNVPIGTAATKLQCEEHGTVIGMFHQYACYGDGTGYGKGQTIHAPVQLEDNGCTVHDKVARGHMKITHPEGYTFRLYARDGLPYLKQARCTITDFHKYPIVHMTADTPWKVDKYDRKVTLHQLEHQDRSHEEDDDSVPELVEPTHDIDDGIPIAYLIGMT